MLRWTLPVLIVAMLFAGLSAEASAKARKARSRHGVKAPVEAVAPDQEATKEPDKNATDSTEPGSDTSPQPEAAEDKPVAASPEAEPPAAEPAEPAEPKAAQVQVFCPLPGADVIVDDEVVGKTPLADALIVAPGKHVFELKRPGYMSSWRELTAVEGARRSVAFDPEEDPESDAPRGRLLVSGGSGDVRVTINGRSRGKYSKAIRLPAGPHLVRLDRKGYEPVEQLVEVPGGGDFEIQAPLRATEETREAYTAQTQTYKRWAMAALIAGAVIAGGSTGVALWGNSKLPGAQDNLALVKADNDREGCNKPDVELVRLQNCDRKLSAAQSDVDKYRNLRTGGIIGAGAGVALIATGVVLWLIAPDARPRAPEEPQPEPEVSTLLPVLSASPDGASLWLRGSF